MNEEVQLKALAYVDGELPARETAEVEALMARDGEVRALVNELRKTSAALAGHEEGVKLPEGREFYWSKIAKAIEHGEVVERREAKTTSWAWLWRSMVPAGALALVCLLVLHSGVSEASTEFTPESETASDEVGAYTFRNQETGLTTVWLYNRDQGSGFTPAGGAASVQQQL